MTTGKTNLSNLVLHPPSLPTWGRCTALLIGVTYKMIAPDLTLVTVYYDEWLIPISLLSPYCMCKLCALMLIIVGRTLPGVPAT